MLDHVIGIKGVNRSVSERQLTADVGPTSSRITSMGTDQKDWRS
jgi:hypothetical protein